MWISCNWMNVHFTLVLLILIVARASLNVQAFLTFLSSSISHWCQTGIVSVTSYSIKLLCTPCHLSTGSNLLIFEGWKNYSFLTLSLTCCVDKRWLGYNRNFLSENPIAVVLTEVCVQKCCPCQSTGLLLFWRQNCCQLAFFPVYVWNECWCIEIFKQFKSEFCILEDDLMT